MSALFRMVAAAACVGLICGAAWTAWGQAPEEVGRYADRTALWEQVGGDLLHGFYNMYNLHIVRVSEDAAYPYRGWFFGWSVGSCNPGYPGCDAIFAARAPMLEGPWEVYRGDGEDGPIWDADMDPARWVPVIAGGETNYDNWHNGDPSVVRREGVYYMVYSATGHNKDGIPYGQEGDTDSDISCVMGATSRDGLHWERTEAPVLVYAPNWGQAPRAPGDYMHERGLYHRPTLLWEEGTWRAWFDCFHGNADTDTYMFSMAYAENTGDFASSEDWRVIRGMDAPCILQFPNPDVVRVGAVLFAYGDPGGYAGEGWATRKTAEAASVNGRDWVLLGYMEPDADVQANQVPEAYVEEEDGKTWIYLTYGGQIPGDYRYDRIRMKRRSVSEEELAALRKLCAGASGPAPFERRPTEE